MAPEQGGLSKLGKWGKGQGDKIWPEQFGQILSMARGTTYGLSKRGKWA